MSSREPSGLRMYDGDATWVELVNGRRDVDVRGFHECLNRGCGGSIRGESLQEARCSRRPFVSPHLFEATARYLFGERDLFNVHSTHTHALPMFIRHTYLFNASTTDAYTDCCNDP